MPHRGRETTIRVLRLWRWREISGLVRDDDVGTTLRATSLANQGSYGCTRRTRPCSGGAGPH